MALEAKGVTQPAPAPSSRGDSVQPMAAVPFPHGTALSRQLRSLACIGAVLSIVLAGPASAPATSTDDVQRMIAVIVRGDAVSAARDAVRASGGRVLTRLPLV